MALIQHTSHWSLVTAQTCSTEPVHVCVRPRNLHRGCGGKAPKKRLTQLIFIRLYTPRQPSRSRPFLKLGASNSGLKLSKHMAFEKNYSRSTGEKSPIQPYDGQSDGLIRYAFLSRTALELIQDPPKPTQSPLESRYDQPVHVCVRPRNLRRGCGGKAPKKRLTPLIFIRLYTPRQPSRSRPFLKLGASNSGLKLSKHMAFEKNYSPSTGEKSPIKPLDGQSDGIAR